MAGITRSGAWVGALVVAQLLVPPLAAARPFLYMTSFSYSGPYRTCLSQAEKALRSHGFTEGLQKQQSDSDKGGLVYANMRGASITAEIKCLQREGISLLGVAGIDNEETWEIYQKLKKADW